MLCSVVSYSSANATPEFEGRGGEELATEISSMLARAYDCPSCLDLNQLCVVEGKQCWIVYIDVLVCCSFEIKLNKICFTCLGTRSKI